MSTISPVKYIQLLPQKQQYYIVAMKYKQEQNYTTKFL